MAECFRCGQDMSAAEGCAEDRTIEFVDGETAEPIPYGEAEQDRTYEQALADYERDIESGGRGALSAADVRDERDAFTERWDAESFNERPCHDCGAAIGEYHHPGCDMEECPRCGGQYFICDCDTEEKRRVWGVADG